MKRRDFSVLAGGAVAAGNGLWSSAALATVDKPQVGTDFLVVDPRAPVEAPAGKIEVVEFFWYNCPHCNSFEPALDAWIKTLPKDVSFRRAPVAFRDEFVPQQRLYFALEAMGLVEKLQAKVFAAIHVERLDLSKAAAIADWVAKQGVDMAKFNAQYSSFSVATKATKATQLQNAYRVEGVPALGVAGRYYVDGALAKNMGNALKIVDTLVAGIRSGK